MATDGSPSKGGRNGELPKVVISEPASPETMGKTTTAEDEGRIAFDEDLNSLDGSQLGVMNNDLDYTSQYSINVAQGGAEALWPAAPDGGYGWVIVLAAFCSNFIVDGVCTCFTEFKKSYSDHFQSSDAATALIGSLLIGVYLLVGPLVGGFVNKFGARAAVVAGAIFSGTAFLISVAAPNIYVFMFIYGGLGGIGFGMIYLPSIVVVGHYFESKRAMATGIAVAGSGVGTIVMPFLSEYSIKTLGWDYAVWILAALVFLCAPLGLLYRPLTFPDPAELREQELEPLRQALSKMSDEDIPMSAVESPNGTRCMSAASQHADDNGDIDDPSMDPTMQRLRNALSECDGDSSNGNDSPAPRQPLSPLLENTVSKTRGGTLQSSFTTRPRKLTLTSMNSELVSNSDLKNSRTNLANGTLSRVSVRSYAQSLSKLSKAGDASTLSIAMSGVDPQEFQRPLNRQDIFYGGSIRNLKEFHKEGDNIQNYRSSVLSIPRSVIGQAASNMNLSQAGDMQSRIMGSKMSRNASGIVEEDDVDDFYDTGRCKCIPLPIRNAVAEMIDVSLLKDPIMIILLLSNLLGMMGFYIPFVFLKDLANDHQIDPSSSRYLVPLIGVTNTIGRVFFGWVADQGFVSALTINNISLISCGFLTLLCPLLSSLYGQLFYAALFGFLISAYICLTSIVLSDLLGLEKLTNSFGLLVVARGIAALLGSPFAGLVYDMTKSYKATFYFGGAVILASGLISCVIPFVHRWQRSNGKNEGDDFDQLADADNLSGKLSVLTERSEENLTEYQRTIQSLRQQYALLQEIEEEKRHQKGANKINGAVEEVNEEDTDEQVPMVVLEKKSTVEEKGKDLES